MDNKLHFKVQTLYYRGCARSWQDELLLIFQVQWSLWKQEESLCNISTDIDQELGRFIGLEIEAVFRCSKNTALRLLFVAQGCFIGQKILSFILTIHWNIDSTILLYAHRLSVRSEIFSKCCSVEWRFAFSKYYFCALFLYSKTNIFSCVFFPFFCHPEENVKPICIM